MQVSECSQCAQLRCWNKGSFHRTEPRRGLMRETVPHWHSIVAAVTARKAELDADDVGRVQLTGCAHVRFSRVVVSCSRLLRQQGLSILMQSRPSAEGLPALVSPTGQCRCHQRHIFVPRRAGHQACGALFSSGTRIPWAPTGTMRQNTYLRPGPPNLTRTTLISP